MSFHHGPFIDSNYFLSLDKYLTVKDIGKKTRRFFVTLRIFIHYYLNKSITNNKRLNIGIYIVLIKYKIVNSQNNVNCILRDMIITLCVKLFLK